MLIGIDHGNRSVKLARVEPFICGLDTKESQPYGSDYLEYKGRYYLLSDNRIPYHRDKSEDDRFFILTLFGIAKEIEKSGKYHTGVIPVQLAIGLPPAFYGAQKRSFINYFAKRGPITFTYRGKKYNIMISDVVCYPQAYAAAVTIYEELVNVPQTIVLDIGGYTADYIRVKSGACDLSVCDSLEKGVILFYNKIRSMLNAEYDMKFDELQIDAILTGKEKNAAQVAVDAIKSYAQEYINDLLSTFREHQIELKAGNVIFVGGGALLFREQIMNSGKVGNTRFIDDIRANAIGYEKMYELSHKGR